MKYTNRTASPLGEILLAADDEGLTGLWFVEDQRDMRRGLSPDAVEGVPKRFEDARRWLDASRGASRGSVASRGCPHRLWAAR